MVDKTINAGTSALNGFALQRNTALHLLLQEYYEKFESKNYFICLEHHEDFLFCFLNDEDEAEIIEAYQAKKKSPSYWRLNNELFDIVTKILRTGKSLVDDSIIKSKKYEHFLIFITNQTIKLNIPANSNNGKAVSLSINEENTKITYPNLPIEIQEKLKKNITTKPLHKELKNLGFIYVDLNRTAARQEQLISQQIKSVFGESIYDNEAAFKTLTNLFHEIELTYNQGNTAKLLDESKRVSSRVIEETFALLTEKAKCFNYWRKNERNISIALKIKPSERETFKLDFEASFDLFKSSEEAEHNKILKFTKDNHTKCLSFTEEDSVNELIVLFLKANNTNFSENTLKAIFFAAFFEATFKK